LLSPEQVSGIIDQTVGPSLETLAQWEEEGKIRGGIFPIILGYQGKAAGQVP
jgi:hypothetical protein